MVKVVVLGAGFAGVRCMQDLSRMMSGGLDIELTLVDKNDFHLFRADLYEVATAFNEKITEECLSRLQDTVATPIDKLIDKKKVKFVRGEVTGIDPEERVVEVGDKKLKYDYMLVALGSVSNDFGIPGLSKYGMALKTVQDGLAINCHIDQYFQDLWKKGEKRDVDIVVGGGGASGVETAAELVTSLDRLAVKYEYPRDKMNIHLVEAGEDLAALDKKGTKVILKHFKKCGINVHLGHRITEVTEDSVKLSCTDKCANIGGDIVIWTGGVRVAPVVAECLGDEDLRGAVRVTHFLQSARWPRIFAAGDNCYLEDPHAEGRPFPMLATTALEEGKVAAKNIATLVRGTGHLKCYEHTKAPYMIPIGGKVVLWKVGNKLRRGRWVWFVRRYFSLKYFMSILPFGEAMRKWMRGTKVFLGND